MKSTIYIKLIDGTECSVPVDAKLIAGNKYVIENIPDYDPDDRIELFEFKPNDIVLTKKRLSKSTVVNCLFAYAYADNTAIKLNINQFLFAILAKPQSLRNIDQYSDFLNIIRDEIKNGIYHYPAIKEYISKI